MLMLAYRPSFGGRTNITAIVARDLDVVEIEPVCLTFTVFRRLFPEQTLVVMLSMLMLYKETPGRGDW